LIYYNIYRLNKNKESPELKDLRKKLSETQEQLELGLEKSQKAEEDATEKAEQVTLKFNIYLIYLDLIYLIKIPILLCHY